MKTDKLQEIILRRVSLDLNDDFGIIECVKQEAAILADGIPASVAFLNPARTKSSIGSVKHLMT